MMIRQTLLDLMVKMMPAMMPLVYLGGFLVVLGLAATAIRLLSGRGERVARLAGWLLIGLALFFLASQVVGAILGATPAINFGDSTKFEFDLKPFWLIGTGLLVPGLAVLLIGGRRRTS